jgi:TonB family protein
MHSIMPAVTGIFFTLAQAAGQIIAGSEARSASMTQGERNYQTMCALPVTASMESPIAQDRRPPDFVKADVDPAALKRKSPDYPPEALRSGAEGVVHVRLWVDTQGRVREAIIAQSDNPIFNAAALDAARQWEFSPATIKGKPVSVWVVLPFKFKLAKKESENPPPGSLPPEQQAAYLTVERILEGEDLDSCMVLLSPDAYLINGAHYISLTEALAHWGSSNGFPNERNRTVVFFNATIDEQAMTFVLKTVGRKKPSVHFHTIVFRKDENRSWKIRHWHASN